MLELEGVAISGTMRTQYYGYGGCIMSYEERGNAYLLNSGGHCGGHVTVATTKYPTNLVCLFLVANHENDPDDKRKQKTYDLELLIKLKSLSNNKSPCD